VSSAERGAAPIITKRRPLRSYFLVAGCLQNKTNLRRYETKMSDPVSNNTLKHLFVVEFRNKNDGHGIECHKMQVHDKAIDMK